ncbi:MAG: hypothetical protein JSV85_04475 [Candidatus Bathyarchaeota archaeon]|nr:MAG: hypothetical protein JSV85_04475 [Candidatus Bathyarchaeota archaeon]
MKMNGVGHSLVGRPRLVKLLVLFYGSHALFFVLTFISLWMLMQGGSGQPGYTPGGFVILILLMFIISLAGALVNMSVAYGILLAKGWARILGIVISVLGLPLLVQGGVSLVAMIVAGFGHRLMDVADIVLSIVVIYSLTRPEVKAYFGKKRISERKEKLSKEEHQEPTEEEYEKLSEEEKHLKDEYEQLMEED